MDSNQRRRTSAGLQPAPFSHSGTPPSKLPKIPNCTLRVPAKSPFRRTYKKAQTKLGVLSLIFNHLSTQKAQKTAPDHSFFRISATRSVADRKLTLVYAPSWQNARNHPGIKHGEIPRETRVLNPIETALKRPAAVWGRTVRSGCTAIMPLRRLWPIPNARNIGFW